MSTKHNIQRYWIWLRVFCRWIGRYNEYYWPKKQCSIQHAAFLAKTISDSCTEIRYNLG